MQPPILLNCWKHHMLFLVKELKLATKQSNLDLLKRYIKYFGNSTTDLYIGNIHENEIAEYCIDSIKKEITLNKDTMKNGLLLQPEHIKPLLCQMTLFGF